MDERYLQLRITAVKKETIDTFTYRFERTDGGPMEYKAGQFLTFIIFIHDTEYRRSYSLSSTPGVDERPAVTIKWRENGEVSRYIIKHWQIGDIVTSMAPSGRFTLDVTPHPPRDIFLLGAGSGITPLYGILRQVLRDEPGSKVTMIYSAKNEHHTPFHKELRALAAEHASRFTLLFFFSEPTEESEFTYRRIGNGLLEMLTPKHLAYDRKQAQFFICGPLEYMRMCIFTLTFMGFTEEQLHKENFTVNTQFLIQKAGTPIDSNPKQVVLTHAENTLELAVPGNQTILQTALNKGITLPFSCRGGVCGACTSRCTEGKVWMAANEVLTDKEVAEGLILTCVAYPVSETVKIEW
ncbi:iron-sulfur cluster-binding domain-containing protein [Chitinophaga horti]|uniref:Iron-sulfur cluster-binding domain-containing protein n=1 Tax=Chitinophaga horti TaxID=2920382 RepID=A0ABY6J0J3_9BACT|nr:iron-sulfur cluster-binding domain-containing protein [Chitinophaga horti]UYQ93150.1 iron-sulfur cluster-binding domain-containing protein [Chitinophaga horti]